MKSIDVLIRPALSEKANGMSEKSGKYTFIVSRRANKLQIKQAIESFYGVDVTDINTAVMPGKAKSRYTKTGTIEGQKPAYKKAIVTLAEGDTIDIFESV